jgi:hypothetical protein
MNDSQKQHVDDSESSQTIRIELPLGALSGMRRMMANFRRPNMSEATCCEPTMNRCSQDYNEENRYEFTVIIGRKE